MSKQEIEPESDLARAKTSFRSIVDRVISLKRQGALTGKPAEIIKESFEVQSIKDFSEKDIKSSIKKVYPILSEWLKGIHIRRGDENNIYRKILSEISLNKNPIIRSAIEELADEAVAEEDKKDIATADRLGRHVFDKTVPEKTKLTGEQLGKVRKEAIDDVEERIQELTKEKETSENKKLKDKKITLLNVIKAILESDKLKTTEEIIREIKREKFRYKYLEVNDKAVLGGDTEKTIDNVINAFKNPRAEEQTIVKLAQLANEFGVTIENKKKDTRQSENVQSLHFAPKRKSIEEQSKPTTQNFEEESKEVMEGLRETIRKTLDNLGKEMAKIQTEKEVKEKQLNKERNIALLKNSSPDQKKKFDEEYNKKMKPLNNEYKIKDKKYNLLNEISKILKESNKSYTQILREINEKINSSRTVTIDGKEILILEGRTRDAIYEVREAIDRFALLETSEALKLSTTDVLIGLQGKKEDLFKMNSEKKYVFDSETAKILRGRFDEADKKGTAYEAVVKKLFTEVYDVLKDAKEDRSLPDEERKFYNEYFEYIKRFNAVAYDARLKDKEIIYVTNHVRNKHVSYLEELKSELLNKEIYEKIDKASKKNIKLLGYKTEKAALNDICNNRNSEVSHFFTFVLVDAVEKTGAGGVPFEKGIAYSFEKVLEEGKGYTINISTYREMLKFLKEVHNYIKKNQDELKKSGGIVLSGFSTTIGNVLEAFEKAKWDTKKENNALPVNVDQIEPLFKKVAELLIEKKQEVEKFFEEGTFIKLNNYKKPTMEFYKAYLDKLAINLDPGIQKIVTDIRVAQLKEQLKKEDTETNVSGLDLSYTHK